MNIGDFLNQIINSQPASGAVRPDTMAGTSADNVAASAATKMLQNLLAGDTFTGYVTSIKDNSVLLTLSNGSQLHAKLATSENIMVGQNITFMVQENSSNTIAIKPLKTNEQAAVMITKALDAAGMPASDANIDIVKELLNLNMPIDKDTIATLAKYSLRFPEANINTIANLLHLNIPVTQESIQQFDAYRNYEHSILQQLNQIPDSLDQMLQHYTLQGDFSAGGDLLQNIISTIYSDVDGNLVNSQPLESYLGKEQLTLLQSTLSEAFSEAFPSGQSIESFGKMTTKEVLDTIAKQLQTVPFNESNNQQDVKANGSTNIPPEHLLQKEGIQNLFQSKELHQLMERMVSETYKLTPKDVGKEESISNFYKRVRQSINNLSEMIDKEPDNAAMSKGLEQIKNNIDFMNDLNKNMSYFQMPVRFSESEGNGELYVFTNKKALANHTDQVSALLHLDMEHLGPMDIYVKLAGKDITTNFCLESEEMLDFIGAHIVQLESRLNNLGYHTHFEMKVNEKEMDHFDFVEDFIQEKSNVSANSQFIFDTKA